MVETRCNNSFLDSVKLKEGYSYHRCDPNSSVVFIYIKMRYIYFFLFYIYFYFILHVYTCMYVTYTNPIGNTYLYMYCNSNTLPRRWQFLRKITYFSWKLRFIEISIGKNAPRKELFTRKKKYYFNMKYNSLMKIINI